MQKFALLLAICLLLCSCSQGQEKTFETETESAAISETAVETSSESSAETTETYTAPVITETEYRDETELQRAVREAQPLWEWRDGRIYIDIDGDNFPERFDVNINELESDFYVYGNLYYYNTDECTWGFVYGYSFLNPFYIYYDREYDEYFYIADVSEVGGAWYGKFIFTDTGIKEEDFGGSWGFGFSHNEDWSKKSGVSFGTLGKHFYFNESLYEGEDDIDTFNKAPGIDYEIALTFDIGQIIREYGYENSEKQFEIFVGDFADSPQPSEYKKPYKEKEEEYITIGGEEISLRSAYVYINGTVTDITEETFEELSRMPYLYGLSLSGGSIDLNGIEKLTGLRLLSLHADTVTNAEKAAELKELTVLRLSPDISDFSFVEHLDSVKVIEFGDTLDKPADFYAPMYKMKGLQYMLASVWERIMTDEQAEHIRENAPWIDICTYKVG